MKRIGHGAETDVYRPKNKKGSREKGIVIKNFAPPDEGAMYPEQTRGVQGDKGFDDGFKEILSDQYRKLRAEYGDIIAQARFIKNPDHPDLNLLVQEHIELADPAKVGEYYPVDIEDEDLREQITKFVEAVKKNIQLARADKPAIIPDLEGENLVFTKDIDRMVYIDSGLHTAADIKDDTILHVARIEMLGGALAEDLRRDPFYTEVFAKYPDLAIIDDEHDFYNALGEHEQELINAEAEDEKAT